MFPRSPRESGRLRQGWQQFRERWETSRAGALSGELPRFFPLFLLVFGVGMILVSLVGDQGLIAYYQLRQETRALRQQVVHLRERRQELTGKIRALREDPAYIELLARRRLGLVRRGETVVEVPAPPRQEP